MPDALLLDWEGCIVDTAMMRQVAAERALREEGLAPDAAPLMDDVLASILAARASRAFAERLGKGFLLRDGARELLENAQVASRVAIVTRATRAETEFVLRLAGLGSAVSTIVSADDDLEAWPSPATFVTAISRLSTRRETRASHSIAIAGSIDALRAARAASLRTVALGAPAHVALEADGAVDALPGVLLSALARIAGIAAAEHST
jgi:beta-phosphoglucomutase-like phosphatase (HAD superfamily)